MNLNARLKFNLLAALPTEPETNVPCVGSGVVSDDRRKNGAPCAGSLKVKYVDMSLSKYAWRFREPHKPKLISDSMSMKSSIATHW